MNRIVVMFLDYAEDQTTKRRTITMAQWSERLDTFLEFNEREILTHKGSVKATRAKEIAKDNYDLFHKARLDREGKEAELEDPDDLVALENIEKRIINRGKP